MKKKSSLLVLTVVIITSMVMGFFFFFYFVYREKEEAIRVTFDFGQPEKNRIAVLFFHDLSANSEDKFLSEGLTEDIITRLAKIEGLNVKSMTDVLRFKDRIVTIREVGKALEVDAVLEGSIRKVGQTLLVTAQLIDVATGLHIWAERYERKISLEDIFGLQNEVATKIAEAAHLKLTQSTKDNLTQKPTISAEAYEFYLKGKYHHLQMTTEGSWIAIELFQKAIQLDPNFALAYADLGDAYAQHYHMVEPPDKFWLDEAQKQIQKALALDAKLPEAHKALGHCYEDLGKIEEAAQAYKIALNFKPDYTDAQLGLGQTYCVLGRYDEALGHLKTALESHPEFSYIYYKMGCVYAMKGEKDKAIEWLQKALKRGFRDWKQIQEDPFLNPVRKDPHFRKIVKDLGKGRTDK